MFQTRKKVLLLFAWVAALAACDASTTAPAADGLPDHTSTPALQAPADAEVGIAGDPVLGEATVQSAEAALGQARSPRVEGLLRTARRRFAAARADFDAGRWADARRNAREGREAVAEALVSGLGPSAADELEIDLQALLDDVESDPESFVAPGALTQAVSTLRSEARSARAAGDAARSAERSIFGHQHVDRDRTDRSRDGATDRARDGAGDRRHVDVDVDLARLAVAAAASGVELAEEFLATYGSSEAQDRLLATAIRLLRSAEEALATGHFRRALILGHQSVLKSLAAVVNVDGVSEAEAEYLWKLAKAKVAAASGEDDHPDYSRILPLAVKFLEAGEQKLAGGQWRPAATLFWYSAVLADILVP